MYRIHFDPKVGKFILQVSRYGFFWANVCVKIQGPAGEAPARITLEFDTFRNACLHADSIGLSALYDDRSENVRRSFMFAK